MPYLWGQQTLKSHTRPAPAVSTPHEPNHAKIWASYTSLMLWCSISSLIPCTVIFQSLIVRETWASVSQECPPACVSQSIRNYFLCITSGYVVFVSRRESNFISQNLSKLQHTQIDAICSMSHSLTSQAVRGFFISYLSRSQLKQFGGEYSLIIRYLR